MTTSDSPRAWQVVLASVEADLLSGALRPGDHLAPERALAANLGVGRSSVREAFRVLEALGLIRTQAGSGPEAGAIVVARPSAGMSTLIRLQVAAHGFPVGDIVTTRLTLETTVAAGLAALDAADLGACLELLDAMDDTTLSPAEFLALDSRFHLGLAETSGNAVITAVMAGLRDSIEGYVTAAVPRLGDWSATAARLRDEHRGVVEAIEAHEPALAAARVRAHITGYYDESRLTSADPTTAPRP